MSINVENAYKLLGLRLDIDLPFEEVEDVERTKEECFELVHGIYQELENADVGPYTLLNFKERANAIARRRGGWNLYYKLCSEYVERYMMRKGKYHGSVSSYARHEEKWPF